MERSLYRLAPLRCLNLRAPTEITVAPTVELDRLYSEAKVKMSRTDGWEKFSCKSLLITYCRLLAAEHLARGWFCLGAVQSGNTSGDGGAFLEGGGDSQALSKYQSVPVYSDHIK